MKSIQIWLDRTGDPNKPAWIVSEEDDARDTSDTIAAFAGDSNSVKALARKRAETEARKRNYTVEETTTDGLPAWHAMEDRRHDA